MLMTQTKYFTKPSMMLTKIRTILDSIHSFMDEYQDFGSNVLQYTTMICNLVTSSPYAVELRNWWMWHGICGSIVTVYSITRRIKKHFTISPVQDLCLVAFIISLQKHRRRTWLIVGSSSIGVVGISEKNAIKMHKARQQHTMLSLARPLGSIGLRAKLQLPMWSTEVSVCSTK
jgi:hypothetical protein